MFTYHIEARVTATDLADMNATLTLTERRDFVNGGVKKVLNYEPINTNLAKTIDLGTYGAADLISGVVEFQAVRPGSPTQPRATTKLKLELLADGKVIETTELNQLRTGWKVSTSPYLKGGVDIETDNL